MNKKNNRKGFTIVELVIVIAVIAILATVLVPTFGNVIENAKKSNALQAARNEYTNYMIDHAADENSANLIIKGADGIYYAVVNGQISDTDYVDTDAALAAFVKDGYTAAVDTTSGNITTVKFTANP